MVMDNKFNLFSLLGENFSLTKEKQEILKSFYEPQINENGSLLRDLNIKINSLKKSISEIDKETKELTKNNENLKDKLRVLDDLFLNNL